jgi:hypothetical protein
MTEIKTEQTLCIVGDSTDRPCRRPAAIQLDRLPHGALVCRFHAAVCPLHDEIDRLYLAAAVIEEELEPVARGNDDGGLLAGLLQQAKRDYRERADFLHKHVRAVEGAATYQP